MTTQIDGDNVLLPSTLVTASDSPYTTSGEEIIHVTTASGAVTITLATDDTTDSQRIQLVDVGRNIETNAVTIQTEGSQELDGSSTALTWDHANGSAVDLRCDGTDWFSSLAVAANRAVADVTESVEYTHTGQSDPTTPDSGEAVTWFDTDDDAYKIKFDDGTVTTLASK